LALCGALLALVLLHLLLHGRRLCVSSLLLLRLLHHQSGALPLLLLLLSLLLSLLRALRSQLTLLLDCLRPLDYMECLQLYQILSAQLLSFVVERLLLLRSRL
jgi:hypothetical protein